MMIEGVGDPKPTRSLTRDAEVILGYMNHLPLPSETYVSVGGLLSQVRYDTSRANAPGEDVRDLVSHPGRLAKALEELESAGIAEDARVALGSKSGGPTDVQVYRLKNPSS